MTRAELYALVWADPMIHVAKRFGLSDVGLRKICKKHDIPTPPLGYWAKLAHGKKVHQPRLPESKAGSSEQVDLVARPIRETPAPVAEAEAAAREREIAFEQISAAAERETAPHPLTEATQKALRKAKPDGEGFVSCSGQGVVNVKVGPETSDRAIDFVDRLLKGCMARGYGLVSGDGGVRIEADGQQMSLRVYVTTDRKDYVPTPRQLADAQKERERKEADHKRWPQLYSKPDPNWTPYPRWVDVPSDRLSVEITDPLAHYRYGEQRRSIGRWHDRSSSPVEQYLPDIMIAISAGAAQLKIKRAEEAERDRRQAEEWERQRREIARQEQVRRQREFITEKAEEYASYTKVAAFGAYLERISGQAASGEVPVIAAIAKRVIADLEEQLGVEALTAEIKQLDLYSTGDDVLGGTEQQ